MKSLRKELEEIIKEVFIDGCYCDDVDEANKFTTFEIAVDDILEVIRKRVKKKKNYQPLPGFINRQFMRLETVKNGNISMAYDDGFFQAIDEVLEELK